VVADYRNDENNGSANRYGHSQDVNRIEYDSAAACSDRLSVRLPKWTEYMHCYQGKKDGWNTVEKASLPDKRCHNKSSLVMKTDCKAQNVFTGVGPEDGTV
jgi:hypothetical protein